ncbi:MAG: sensor histidine kinase [Gemmataceae bacterium]
MSLTSRMSAFFLATLALVLVGFSLSLYLLAQSYLHQKVKDRLRSALDTLAAAAEVKPDILHWEPEEHHLMLGKDGGADHVRWEVRDGQGRRVDGSANLDGSLFVEGLPPASNSKSVDDIDRDGRPWCLARRRLRPEHFSAPLAKAVLAAPSEPEAAKPGSSHRHLPNNQHIELVLAAGLSLEPLQETLHRLALTLAALSLGLWLAAAAAGRWICRKALDPMTRMAAAARAMNAQDLNHRLPSPATGDELEDLHDSFNGLLARLEEAFERQRRFSGDVSHQLRTPLTAMLGQVEVILRRERPPQEYRHALSRVHQQAVQLRQIVEMLLFLARADAEAIQPSLVELDLAAWLELYLRDRSAHPRQADFHLDVDLDQPRTVRAHPALLAQLLDNLLENACNYSSFASPIYLRLRRQEKSAVLAVEDRGCGISAEDLTHLCEPFFRSPRIRQSGKPGIGLGLAVVRRIATVFGGTLSVQSVVGRGSCFRLRLPLSSEHLPREDEANVPAPPSGTEQPQGRSRVELR